MELIPIYQSSVILNNLLCGGIVFREFDHYEWQQLLVIVIGTGICVCGILIILRKFELVHNKDKQVVMVEDKERMISHSYSINNLDDTDNV